MEFSHECIHVLVSSVRGGLFDVAFAENHSFAPVSIMTGIYGMNVSEISGDSSNPNIWQFFVAMAIFSAVVVVALSISAWIQIHAMHRRRASLKEILGHSIGKAG